MDIDARVEAWASLQLVPGLTARALFELLKSLGGPAEVRAAEEVPHTKGGTYESKNSALAACRQSSTVLVSWDDTTVWSPKLVAQRRNDETTSKIPTSA